MLTASFGFGRQEQLCIDIGVITVNTESAISCDQKRTVPVFMRIIRRGEAVVHRAKLIWRSECECGRLPGARWQL